MPGTQDYLEPIENPVNQIELSDCHNVQIAPTTEDGNVLKICGECHNECETHMGEYEESQLRYEVKAVDE